MHPRVENELNEAAGAERWAVGRESDDLLFDVGGSVAGLQPILPSGWGEAWRGGVQNSAFLTSLLKRTKLSKTSAPPPRLGCSLCEPANCDSEGLGPDLGEDLR